MKKIDLYIIVGFLGSGKTTFLKNLLPTFENKKIGIIINDFGDESIDSRLFDNSLYRVKEVNKGSIFCS